jgi:hypothetical protein
MGGACSTYREKRGAYKILVGRPEGKRDPDVEGSIILKFVFKKWDGA